MTLKTRVFLSLAAALILAAPVTAQTNADFTTLLDGRRIPLTLKLKDLGPGWRHFIPGIGDNFEFSSRLYGRRVRPYYTRGATESVGGETYLIAYREPAESGDFPPQIVQSGVDPAPSEPLTGEIQLSLSLLDLRTSGSLNNIEPFDLREELHAADEHARQQAATASPRNLKQLGTAMRAYVEDYDEVFPPITSPAAMKKILLPLTQSESTFIQPSTKQPYQFNPFLSRKKLSAIVSPAGTIMIYEASPGPDGMRAVAFVDGHVKRIPETDWPRLNRESHIP